VHDRIYVGDTGGNVWRADISGEVGSSDQSDWKLTLLAQLGRHAPGAAGKVEDRRFFHRPDVVQSFDRDGQYDAVILGSGDRPDPLDRGGIVTNWAYMIKDRQVGLNGGLDSALTHADIGDVTNTCQVRDGACEADLSNGWRLRLVGAGEKALATPLTIANVVYFTTYLPPGALDEGACSPSEGNGRLYAVALRDAAAVNNYNITTEEPDRYTELASRGIPAEVVSLPPSFILRPDLQVERAGGNTRLPTYWFESEDADL
jgi:type IV pilus assembly protein PilY1